MSAGGMDAKADHQVRSLATPALLPPPLPQRRRFKQQKEQTFGFNASLANCIAEKTAEIAAIKATTPEDQ
ncbi:hypothetical protein H0H87_010528 [Tephrocybe sp. NHM501043]|nr:hypothetical protein H0H87_010528 [Tephrocybe sp. NHM501043]